MQPSIFTHADDHAGEMETSFGLACFNHLVGRNADGSLIADDGKVAPHSLRGGEQRLGVDHAPLGTCSRPTRAQAIRTKRAPEKGHKLLDLVVERLAPFLVELSQATLDEKFPF